MVGLVAGTAVVGTEVGAYWHVLFRQKLLEQSVLT